MSKTVRPNRFLVPTAAQIVIWVIMGLVALSAVMVVVTLKFFPGIYR